MENNSKRINHLKNELLDSKREISFERARLYTESYRNSLNDEAVILKRAKATANILDNVEIVINKGELIAGGRTKKYRSGIASPEMSPYWILDELDTMETRPQDQFYVSDKDKEFYRNELFSYWNGKSLKHFVDGQFSDVIKDAVEKKIVSLNQTDKGQGHIIPSFDKLLNKGLDYMVLEVKENLKKGLNKDFYNATLITLEAVQRHIERYAKLAKDMSEVEEDIETKLELQEISRISYMVSTDAPESFNEAVQLFWYVNIALQYESNASSISPGRFDQYMYPFYKKSKEDGVKLEFTKELLRCLWLKMNDVILLRSENSAKYFAGFPSGYTIILGGVDKNGRDATNDLSFLVLDTYSDIKLPQPNLGVRISEHSPQEFLIKVAETIRLGTGIPQVFNDEVIIPGYLNRGVSLEDARDYAVVGCVELSIPGKTYGLHDIAMFNLLKILELTLEDNVEYDTFEDLLNEIEINISKYVSIMVDGSNIVDKAHGDYAPTPLMSAFIENCVESGVDVSQGGAIYNFSGVQGIGIGNLSDSLFVIKKLVFDDKEMTLKQLEEILKSNYKDNEALRQRFINKFAKYGNDIADVDNLGSRILSHYSNEVSNYSNVRDGKFQPGSYTVSAHIPLGEAVGATPDGRMAKEQLADGGLSPMAGRDVEGPTAVLKSVSKLDNYLTTNGSLLNIKLNPSALEGRAGINQFIGYLNGFMRLKIQHVQFNIISADTLKKAQKYPEQYKSLVIRVAGYSAIFTDLNKSIQDDIISRTEHML